MRKFYLLCFFGFILVMGFASAEISSLKPVKINTYIDLPQIELGSTYQNLTFIQLPDGTKDIIGQYMNKSDNSYSFKYGELTQVGTYTANGCSDISCWNYEFEVTRDGTPQTGTDIIGKLLIWVFGYVFVYIIFIQFNKTPLYRFIGYILLLGNSFLGLLFTENPLPWIMVGSTTIMIISYTKKWMDKEVFENDFG